MTSGVQALLFDMDGTLIDSMGMWKQIDVEYLGRFGIEPPADLQKQLEGMRLQETAVYMKNRFGISDSPKQMMQDWTDMAADFYLHEVKLKPGAEYFLREAKKRGMKLAIATSNALELAVSCLQGKGLYELFDEVVTADETKSKPDPDIYQEAAGRLQVSPDACLVFEDIPMGILAGKRAGMKVCAVQDAYALDQIEQIRELADYMISDFRQVLDGTYERL